MRGFAADTIEGVAQAVSTLGRNPLRTALSSLAVAVAVATTAVVQTALEGLERSARQASARAFGSESFLLTRVAAGSLSRRELAEKLDRNPNIRRDDVRFLERVADDRVVYAPTAQRSADVTAGSRTFENATVSGTRSTLPAIREIALDRGRFMTAQDDTSAAQVAVLGYDVADALFPGQDPLGRTVRIGRRGFLVIGTQAAQGSSGGQSLDRVVYLPLLAFERTFGALDSLQVFAGGAGGTPVEAAEDHARISMRARRHLAPGQPDTFDLVTPEASRSFVARITEQISAAGPPIALIALFAAVVVVTNTALVSVTQRTREIGIRRAVGASRRNIVVETLAEAVLVSTAGGLAGLSVAAIAVRLASGPLGTPLTLTLPVMAGSLLAAALTGMAAGWYPARRASSIDVIDALRAEG